MAGVILNKSELKALAAVDGTRAQAEMSPEIRLRLYDLGLIERREWPNGSLWRTDLGDRHVRRGLVLLSNVSAAAVPSSVAASPSPHLITPTEAGSRLVK
jgi:hypothetical protein